MREEIGHFGGAVFADVCKFGTHPQAGLVAGLQNEGLLPAKWRSVGAANTYNPLGNLVTFLSHDDIVNAALEVAK